MTDTQDEEDYFLPLEDQRVFGAGIRRKRIPFVRSSEPDLNTTSSALRSSHASAPPSTTSGARIANTYLSLVLSKSTTPTPGPPSVSSSELATTATSTTNTPPPSLEHSSRPATTSPYPSLVPHDQNPTPSLNETPICEVCNLPLNVSYSKHEEQPQPSSPPSSTTPKEPYRPHEASLAHQLCLTHSHPPSHLDRTRHGMRYLASYGWDPDSRLGLGAPGREGIREPVKGKLKVDTVGLGVNHAAGVDTDEEDLPANRRRGKRADQTASAAAAASKSHTTGGGKGKVQKLNAKEVRKGQIDAKKRGERLRELFYQDERILQYLGGGEM
ncbi:putative G-patch domain protein [Aspergillus saccharolyticus JOP 1030-1]|uniref:G-patch domain-containing protein n=1 Tax=Aspergillus saccharolyticus JOP 1030-1 TaxID=1450539 RepID=A0A318ZRE0_9EURO|nr:hypothetical protein BP01DRAFT_352203 [Aspergillus saccharolyticus JOP 1030-1]PYH49637.1 hypothetical protein BP01DRAFT_352203 [Aspergillus saccharolyticus JOP 1030-1]